MESLKSISSQEQYNEYLKLVYIIMNKGEDNLTDSEIKWLTDTAIVLEQYENKVMNFSKKITGHKS
jgi:hypothetical protein